MHERHGATTGGKRSRLYIIWSGMRARCNDPKHHAYQHYGARGIKVCEDWSDSFSIFQRWALANGYRSDKSIDRIDNAKGYEPSNCRWATDKMQARNKMIAVNALAVEHDGKTVTMAELARVVGIGYTTLVKRYKNGLRGDELIKKPRAELIRVQWAKGLTRNGNAKLTPQQVEEIRESSEVGAVLAKQYHVAESTISMIRSGLRR